MSIHDDIERLRQLANSDLIPTHKIRLLQEDLVDHNADVAEVLGAGHGFSQGIGAAAAAIADRLDSAIAACEAYETAIHDAADRLEANS
jgi:hypothetical protein